MQCGGSDGYSGITANPALGHASDLLVAHGGTTILSETPEIYGVEHTLTRRAASRDIGEKLIDRIRWWKDEYSVGRDVQNDEDRPRKVRRQRREEGEQRLHASRGGADRHRPLRRRAHGSRFL